MASRPLCNSVSKKSLCSTAIRDAQTAARVNHANATVGLALLDTLSAAHGAGVLHRDDTPQNVLISDDRRVVLADFGLATWTSDAGWRGRRTHKHR